MFELWGSPGGYNGGQGGFTRIYMPIDIDRPTDMYVIVGGSGTPSTGNQTMGGYNGGGYVKTCLAGPHAGSGGGMTHVSYTANVADANAGTWDPTGTIAVAGGGGGGGSVAGRGYGGGAVSGMGGGSNGSRSWSVEPSTQEDGYKRGVGQWCANSSGGGGGWWGGRSAGLVSQTNGGNCGAAGAGGTGYICEPAKQTRYTHLNCEFAGNDTRIPAKPNAGTANAVNGYVRVTLYDENL